MENDDELYAITDIEGYALEMREAAAKSLSDSDEDNLDEYISLGQMINLVKCECIGFDNKNRPLLNEDANAKIYESTIAWIHNVGLAKLAAQGYIECAWDDCSNEMIFWSNPETLKKTSKTKANSNVKSNKRRNRKKDTGS